ncbi:MAG: hypothetical protein M0Z93_03040 [Actinomycetota bacterium]|jgi:hypothetical protein|nr:hypothetical protein [Actinomycetota bacterium]
MTPPARHDTGSGGSGGSGEHVAQTAIEVRARIFPMAWLLLFFKTTVTIDEVDHVVPWGRHVFPVEPGQHEVRVSFRYIGAPRMGENGLTVDVARGQTVRIYYRSPFLIFLQGKIGIAGG